jgi:hypothetical protein
MKATHGFIVPPAFDRGMEINYACNCKGFGEPQSSAGRNDYHVRVLLNLILFRRGFYA